MSEGSKQGIEADDEVVATAELRDLKKRIRELERVLGRSVRPEEGPSRS